MVLLVRAQRGASVKHWLIRYRCCWSSKRRLCFWQITQCQITRQSLNDGFEQGLVATGRFQLSVVVAVVVFLRISTINTSKESTKYTTQKGSGATVVFWVAVKNHHSLVCWSCAKGCFWILGTWYWFSCSLRFDDRWWWFSCLQSFGSYWWWSATRTILSPLQ